jgi:hypothetical protein
MASISSSKRIVSWAFAPERSTAGGTPWRSTTRRRSEAGVPRSIGFGPVAPPPFARTLAPSRLARNRSIRSASPSQSSKVRCSRSHTPAACQSRSRRQQVDPLPRPNSVGSICQGMPLLGTKTTPDRHARSGTRGSPPFGFGGSFGNSGAVAAHSSSDTSGLHMPSHVQASNYGSETGP